MSKPSALDHDVDNEIALRRSRLIIPSIDPAPDFNPGDDDPCLCGSNQPFADCCGRMDPDRPPPYGIFVLENYLSAEQARDWTGFARQQSGERLTVIDREKSTANNIVKVEDPRRVSERVNLGARRDELNQMIRQLYLDASRRFLGQELDWFESPELMRYRPGGLYVRHADSQNMNPDTRLWHKCIDRDLSLLIYLNDDFEGGQLHFTKFNYWVQPQPGMVVLFPSDNRYMHEAEYVTSGERFVIVSWASAKGVPKIAPHPPEPALFFD